MDKILLTIIALLTVACGYASYQNADLHRRLRLHVCVPTELVDTLDLKQWNDIQEKNHLIMMKEMKQLSNRVTSQYNRRTVNDGN